MENSLGYGFCLCGNFIIPYFPWGFPLFYTLFTLFNTHDMDIIPSDLSTYSGEARKLLEDLQSRNERMFLVTVLMMNTAQTKQKLDNLIFHTAGIAQKYNCSLRRLDYQQEPGMMSCVPLGKNYIPINRALTTTAAAIFVPFTTQELFQDGEALYYDLNGVSNNMIMVDR